LSLDLTAPGCDCSLLREFRTRLIAGAQERLLLEAMLTRFKVRGWLRARGSQRIDSIHVLAVIRTRNRRERVGDTLRAALNRLAIVAPDWLLTQGTSDGFARYARRLEAYRLPTGKAAREVYAAQMGTDGFRLRDAIAADDNRGWRRKDCCAAPTSSTLALWRPCGGAAARRSLRSTGLVQDGPLSVGKLAQERASRSAGSPPTGRPRASRVRRAIGVSAGIPGTSAGGMPSFTSMFLNGMVAPAPVAHGAHGRSMRRGT
jgi:hypothetical protein